MLQGRVYVPAVPPRLVQKTRLIYRPYTSTDFRPRPSERLPHRQPAHTVPASLIRYVLVLLHRLCNCTFLIIANLRVKVNLFPHQKRIVAKGIKPLGDNPFQSGNPIACRICGLRRCGAEHAAGTLGHGFRRDRQRVSPIRLRHAFPIRWLALSRCLPAFPKPA